MYPSCRALSSDGKIGLQLIIFQLDQRIIASSTKSDCVLPLPAISTYGELHATMRTPRYQQCRIMMKSRPRLSSISLSMSLRSRPVRPVRMHSYGHVLWLAQKQRTRVKEPSWSTTWTASTDARSSGTYQPLFRAWKDCGQAKAGDGRNVYPKYLRFW